MDESAYKELLRERDDLIRKLARTAEARAMAAEVRAETLNRDVTVLGDQCDVYLARAEKAEARVAELEDAARVGATSDDFCCWCRYGDHPSGLVFCPIHESEKFAACLQEERVSKIAEANERFFALSKEISKKRLTPNPD